MGDEGLCELGEKALNEMREVLEKYEKQEQEIEASLKECKKKREELLLRIKNEYAEKPDSGTDYLSERREKAMARNKQLLEDFRKVKAVLRTQSIYSPNEEELRELSEAYRKASGLKVDEQ